jgi:hypothetical protein
MYFEQCSYSFFLHRDTTKLDNVCNLLDTSRDTILILCQPMLKLTTDYGLHELFLNSNMTSIMGYIHYVNNRVIKLQIYFNSHMRIV